MKKFVFTNLDLLVISHGDSQAAALAEELLAARQAVLHDSETCNCDPQFRHRRSPGICAVEPCHYDYFHKKGQTHNQYHGWKA